MKRLPKSFLNVLGLIVTLIVVFAYFSYRVPKSFPTVTELQTLARQTAIVGLVAIGMTYVIVNAGIDLSVGSTVAFTGVVIAWILRSGIAPSVPVLGWLAQHLGIAWIALLGGVAAGGLAGLLNGGLITKLKVVPFIVTLGTMLMIRGAGTGIANEQTVNPPDSWLTNLLAVLGPDEKWKIVPVGVWLTVILAVLASLGLKYTRFGRHVIAVGSNEHAARLCGVPADRVRLFVYVISGAFAGLAGLMQFSRLTVGDPTVANGLELDAIAAVVIGGASLTGGEGSILGTMLGALIMATLRSGAAQIGWDNWVQQIVTGIIIVLAVALDRLRRKQAT